MSGVQLTGLTTGIDTSAIVEQLMLVESQRLNTLEDKQTNYQDKLDALQELQGYLEALQDAMDELSDEEDLRGFETTTSDEDVVTATASAEASEGSHTVIINQLACSERLVHSAGVEYKENLVGAGTFIFSYNDQECVITTTDETTLEDMVGLINNSAANEGVTASLLYNDGMYYLVLNGDDAGSDYQVTVNSSNTEVWQMSSEWTTDGQDASSSDKIQDLDQFSGSLSGDETIAISGTTHDGTTVNASVAINKNTTIDVLLQEIEDAFGDTATATLENGQIVLTDKTCGTSLMTLNLSYNAGSGSTTLDIPTMAQTTEGGSVTATLAGFAASDFVETQSAQDCQIKVDGYPIGEDEWLVRSTNSVDDVIVGVTLNLQDTGTAKVNLTRNTESLKEKINNFVTAYNNVKTYIDDVTDYEAGDEDTDGDGDTSDEGTAGVLMTDSTVRNMMSNLRTSLIRQVLGFSKGTDTFLLAGDIGIAYEDDGTLTFTESDFDEAIAEDYEGVLSLIGAQKTGSSDSNTIGFYGASTMYTQGGTYNVQVTVSGGVITSAQIKLNSDTTWRDATISGNMITGDSTFNDDDPVYAENSLQLSVDLSKDGTFSATIQVQQGFAGNMLDTLDDILKSVDGTLTMDIDNTKEKIDDLQDDIDDEEDRLTRRQTALEARYARLEATLTALQGQLSILSSA